MKRVGGIAALLLAAASLAACSAPAPAPAPSTEQPAPTITAQPGTGSNTAPPEETAEPEVATCENLLPETLITQFEEMGWSYQQSQLFGVDAPLPDSVQCTWGDYESHSSEAVQIYAWSPIDEATATAMQDALVTQGWTREVDGDVVYITAGDRSAVVDENGYGMTYKFVEGSVTYADTKQGLVLVQWPR
ncbi:hypothetical protein ACQUSY_09110 [Microbacterium sp. YY-03]|uniref:hypothetical protein n=1 Tax=Microbacterium sp. YY-03 TaxID=3421636 RepID=UPI003D178EAF